MDILLAQINPTVGDVAGNAALMAHAHAEGAEKGADLVVFPELGLSGYPPEDLVLKPAFMDAIEAEVTHLSALCTTGKPALIVSTPWRLNDQLHNALLLLDGGQIAAIRPKHHLPNYGVFDEMRVFAPGPMPEPVDFRGHKLGLMTCEDMWHRDVAAHLAASGAELLIVPNGSPFEAGKTLTRVNLGRARVAETGLPLIYLNQVGGQDELVFDGASFALERDGSLALQMAAFAPDAALISFEDAHFALPQPHDVRWVEGEESIFEALKVGLGDYVRKNNFPGVILGLSGGIDSALAAVIAAEALGGEQLTCVLMPSPYTAKMSVDDALALCENLGCAARSIGIMPGMEAFSGMLGDDANKGLTPENIQSRLRGMILMSLSNANGAMVVATGNKSEMAVGYATLYGDMCGGYAVLKDLYKTQVFALCRWINARTETPLIPPRIITRPPSAELKEDQRDDDSLPPYDVLDAILQALIEHEAPQITLIEQGYAPATIERVRKMLDRAEYKRRQGAPGVKITPRAFGRDRRYPITNAFAPQLLEIDEKKR